MTGENGRVDPVPETRRGATQGQTVDLLAPVVAVYHEERSEEGMSSVTANARMRSKSSSGMFDNVRRMVEGMGSALCSSHAR